MKVKGVLTAVRRTLLDQGVEEVFSDTYLLDLVNEATTAILTQNPYARTTDDEIELDAGPRQTLASGDIYLHDVLANRSSEGRGRTVRRVSREQLDNFVPNWMRDDPATEVEHFTFDEQEPDVFYVYPPNDGNGVVHAVVTRIPSKVEDSDVDLPLRESFFDAYLNYMMYRVLDAESDEPNAFERAETFYTRFAESLGVKLRNRLMFSPNQARQPSPDSRSESS